MRILCLITICLCSVLATAQGTTWGVKAGANLSTLTEISDFDSKIGFQFGAVAEIELSDDFSIQPEILYSTQGYTQDVQQQDVVARIDYLILPVSVNWEFVDDLNVQLGPQLGINTRSDIEVDDQESGMVNVNDVDFGLVFGLQLEIDDNFFVQGRYNLGLSDVQLNGPSKHSVFSLSVGFFFDKAYDDDEDDD